MIGSALAILVVVAWSAVASPGAFQSPQGCAEWRDCRDLALAAADRREYEVFHDLAWRAVQTGPARDPALMYLLARAQSLSGRPHDALIMLDRLAAMGAVSDAATNDDFRRTRELRGWPEVEARIERARRADPRPVAVVTPAPLAEAARFSTRHFAVAGLVYDAVSRRFLFGDRLGRRVVVLGEGSSAAVDLVRADSTGFHDISAIEIDARRGDLWVASAAAVDGAGALHRLQLISGRLLRTFHVAADLEPVNLVDLAVSPSGAVLVLDSASRQVLILRAGRTSLEHVVRITAPQPASLAAGGDEGVAFVAHRDGVSRIDVRAGTATPIAASNGIPLVRFERIRWHQNALIAVGVDVDGSRSISRLELNTRGTAVTRATKLEVPLPITGQTVVTVSGDELVYLLANAGAGLSPDTSGVAEFVAYRVRLR